MGLRDTLWTRGAQLLAAARGRVPEGLIAHPDRWGGGYRSGPARQSIVGLTPTDIPAILEEADNGYPLRLWELLEQMEDRDLHLVSVLGTRKRAVANLKWTVEPSDDRRRPRKVAEFVQGRLNAIDNLEDAFVDLLDATSKGVGIGELDWYSRPGEVGIRTIKYRPQRWFRPDPDDPDRWRLLGDSYGIDGLPLPPARFIVHTSKAKSGFPVQAGLGRVLLWWYLFKNYAIKYWVMYAEVFGMPFRIGKYPVGTKPADIAALQRAVRMLGVDASAVIQDGMKLEFLKDAAAGRGGAEVYQALADFCEAGFSKAVLGQTLTTDTSKNGGTRAQGEVHDRVRMDIVRSDARPLSRTINADLVRPLVWFQFGPEEPLPNFRLDVEPPEDELEEAKAQNERAGVFEKARNLGVPVPLAQVQLELNIRVPNAGEEVLAATASATPGAEASADVPRAGRNRFTPARDFTRGWTFSQAGPPSGAMAEVEAAAARYREGGGQEAWKGLIEAVRARLDQARSIDEVPNLLIDLAGRMELGPLVTEISDAVVTGELIGRIQARGEDKPVGNIPEVPPAEAVDFWTSKAVMSPREFYALQASARSQAFTISRFTSLSALGEAKDLLENVIREGGTLSDFEDGLDGVYQRAGMDPLHPSRLRTVFDNAVFTAYSVGRYREFTKPEALALRPVVRYHTMEDSLVRPTHQPMNGWTALMDDPIWDVWWSPNGHGCRCWQTVHSLEEARRNGWVLNNGQLPRSPDDGGPLVPDRGWGSNPAKKPHQFDWSRFPSEWLKAIGVEGA